MRHVTDYAMTLAAGDIRSDAPTRPRERRLSWDRPGWWLMLIGLSPIVLGACSLDSLLKSDQLPPNVTDPAITETPDGARAAYYSALEQLQFVYGNNKLGADFGPQSFLMATGYLSDELSAPLSQLDARQLAQPAGSDQTFDSMNNLRQRARQAVGLLGDYLPEEPALQAHLYAVQGYAEVMLAELYCSGIPLSTVDYHGDYTLRPGSSTVEVFTHATALFDTALALAGDSARILNLSRIGRGRALLSLGNYAAAAAAVAEVPDAFRYTLIYTGVDSAMGIGLLTTWTTSSDLGPTASVQDREGTNGLDYRTSNDPRTRTTLINGVYHPDKYHADGVDTVVLASGVEARLIEAEAALQAGDVTTWLAKLNALRTDGTYDLTETSPPDTLWHAGIGGVDSLAPLADPDPSGAPGPTGPRVDLLFRERAFWLFLTGHRQGDMRRLVRQYGRLQSQVYPVGTQASTGKVYGSYIDVPIPLDEQTLNPLFTGCSSRD